MEKLTFDSFTKKIYIKASIEKLYWSWATSAGISTWFLKKAQYTTQKENTRMPNEFIQTEDHYIWEWHNWEGKEKGNILQANGTDFIEFSFAEDTCKVSVLLEEKNEAVLVSLKQYDMATDEDTKMNIYNGCSCGWTFWLANLKAYLEHGILLNETEVDLRNLPLAGFEFVNI